MHDHSRFQRDVDDVTGVSLSLSLSLTLTQKSLTHNIGSASALPIMTRRTPSNTFGNSAMRRSLADRWFVIRWLGTRQFALGNLPVSAPNPVSSPRITTIAIP